MLGLCTLKCGWGPSMLILPAYTIHRVDIVSERLGVWKRFVVAIPNTVLGYIAYIPPGPLPLHSLTTHPISKQSQEVPLLPVPGGYEVHPPQPLTLVSFFHPLPSQK
jgi:hypothetical protein